MKNILFVSWDGPQNSYMEGLFFPIFQEIQRQSNFQFHVIQFTWANKDKFQIVSQAAISAGINYDSSTIIRKPNVTIGSFLTVLKGIKIIKNYIKEHDISIVMPRSTLPALMINRLKNIGCKIIFDADGLPLEERIDFASLDRYSLQYKFLKAEETSLLKSADKVITRSEKSIDIHIKHIGEEYRNKFFVVANGRNIDEFAFNESKRVRIREILKLDGDSILWVYCGSLGAQYGWQEMMEIFSRFLKNNPSSKFLILTGNREFARDHLERHLETHCIIKKVPFQEVPDYLSAADIAFAIRKPTYSMQGVAPIKLGEYLLMGLPTIASMGIGDTEQVLKGLPGTYGFHHEDPLNIEGAVEFASNLNGDVSKLRKVGIDYFSLERSAATYLKVFSSL